MHNDDAYRLLIRALPFLAACYKRSRQLSWKTTSLPPKEYPHPRMLVLFFTLNREDFSFVIHLDRQPRTSRRREAQTGSRARSGSRSERTLDAVEHSRTLMEWWPFLIFHRGGLRIKVINNTRMLVRRYRSHCFGPTISLAVRTERIGLDIDAGSRSRPLHRRRPHDVEMPGRIAQGRS